MDDSTDDSGGAPDVDASVGLGDEDGEIARSEIRELAKAVRKASTGYRHFKKREGIARRVEHGERASGRGSRRRFGPDTYLGPSLGAAIDDAGTAKKELSDAELAASDGLHSLVALFGGRHAEEVRQIARQFGLGMDGRLLDGA